MRKIISLVLALGLLSTCRGTHRAESPMIVLDLGKTLPAAEFDGPADARPELRESPGQLRIRQKSQTSVSYYLKADAGTLLAFGVGEEESSRGVPIYSVLVKSSDEMSPQVLYQEGWFSRFLRKIHLRDRIEVTLPNISGLLRVTLKVDSDDKGTIMGVWLNPRIEKSPQQAEIPLNRHRAESNHPSFQDANFIVVVLDASRADRFGCYGYRKDVTPNIDRYAADGIICRNAMCEAVFTQASVGSLFTSQYPDRHGSYRRGFGLGPKTTTFTQLLHAGGWETAMITAAPNASSLYGYDRGFGTLEELYRYNTNRVRIVDAHENVDSAIEWIRTHSGKKYFLYCHIREPHTPHTPPVPYYGKFSSNYSGPFKNIDATDNIFELSNSGRLTLPLQDRAYISDRYDENLAYADSQVGRFMDFLRSTGSLDHTVVLIMGDHGEGMGEHSFFGHNEYAYKEIAHMPMIWLFPSSVPQKRKSIDETVGILDVAPTILALAGLTPPAGEMQGRNLVPVLMSGATLPASPHFVRTVGDDPIYGVLQDDYQYFYSTRKTRRELYHLPDDPQEQRNISEEQSLRAGYLHQTYQIWLQEQVRLAINTPSAQVTATPEEVKALIGLGYVNPNQGTKSTVPPANIAVEEPQKIEFEKAHTQKKQEKLQKNKKPVAGSDSEPGDSTQRVRRHRPRWKVDR